MGIMGAIHTGREKREKARTCKGGCSFGTTFIKMNDFTFTDKGFSDYVYWQSVNMQVTRLCDLYKIIVKKPSAMA